MAEWNQDVGAVHPVTSRWSSAQYFMLPRVLFKLESALKELGHP